MLMVVVVMLVSLVVARVDLICVGGELAALLLI
jgi:hypothetical protein